MEQEKELTQEDIEEVVKIIEEHLNEAPVEYKNIAGLSLPDYDNARLWRDDFRRNLYIDGDITEDSIELVYLIEKYNHEDKNIEPSKRQPIKIYFNSAGGYLNIALTLSDAIRLSKTPIIGINMGECCSAAALIYSACHYRASYPSGYWLIHLGQGGTYGTYKQSKAQQKDYDMRINRMKQVFIDNLALNKKQIKIFEELIDEEWYLYATCDDKDSNHNAEKFNLINFQL